MKDFAFADIDRSYPKLLTLSISLFISIVTILFISLIDNELNILSDLPPTHPI